MTVAQAAPAIPILNPKMNNGSRTVLSSAPTIIAIIEYVALPSARTSGLKPIEIMKNGIPNAVIPAYSLAYPKI